jgi:hypothetical protein
MMLLYITRVILGITTATKKNNPSRRYQTRMYGGWRVETFVDCLCMPFTRGEQTRPGSGREKNLLFRVEKILPMPIPLYGPGLNFRTGLGPGPGLGGPPAYFIV